jgi:hypothetical protein
MPGEAEFRYTNWYAEHHGITAQAARARIKAGAK